MNRRGFSFLKKLNDRISEISLFNAIVLKHATCDGQRRIHVNQRKISRLTIYLTMLFMKVVYDSGAKQLLFKLMQLFLWEFK